MFLLAQQSKTFQEFQMNQCDQKNIMQEVKIIKHESLVDA